MNTITIRCPHCDKSGTVPESAKGREIGCKACGKRFAAIPASANIEPAAEQSPRSGGSIRSLVLLGVAAVMIGGGVWYFLFADDQNAKSEIAEAERYAAAGNKQEAIVRYLRVIDSNASDQSKLIACLGLSTLHLNNKDYAGYIAASKRATQFDNSGKRQLALAEAYLLMLESTFNEPVGYLMTNGKIVFPNRPSSEQTQEFWTAARIACDDAVKRDPALQDKAKEILDRIPEARRK